MGHSGGEGLRDAGQGELLPAGGGPLESWAQGSRQRFEVKKDPMGVNSARKGAEQESMGLS